MASQDLESWFTQAAAIAAKIPKNLQEAAFNRALDHLMKGVVPAGHSQAVTPRTPKARTSGTSDSQPGRARDLVSSIDRTRHPDVGATARLADRALKVLELALHHHSTDGLSAGAIAEILTKTFRLPAKRNAVAMALARERTTANLQRQGSKSVFHITQPGEEYLARLRAGTVEQTPKEPVTKLPRAGKPRRSSPKLRATKASQGRPEAKGERGPTPKKKANSGRLGPKAAIERLIENGFFGSARTISEVRDELKHRLGYDFALQELSISLVRLLRSNALQRERRENNQYEYRA